VSGQSVREICFTVEGGAILVERRLILLSWCLCLKRRLPGWKRLLEAVGGGVAVE